MDAVLMAVGGTAVLMVLWACLIYNTAVTMRRILNNALSQIDVQLRRRHDLVQTLLETAKSYRNHERETLESVIKACRQAVDAKGLEDIQAAENVLHGSLRRLFAVSERHPDWKADARMKRLHEEFVSTEDRIIFAQRFYNDEAARYNEFLRSFPNNLFLTAFGFRPFAYFDLETSAETQVPAARI